MLNFNLLQRAVITEKATAAQQEGKYQFFARKDATKVEIAQAFKKLYGVDVAKVNVMRTPGKQRTGRTRNIVTKKRECKKVIITVKGKKNIDVNKPKLKS